MPSTFPPCFGSKEQFEQFEIEGRDLIMARPEGYSYCYYCSPGFQREKLAQDECIHPETEFQSIGNEDGEPVLVGIRPVSANA